MTIKSGLELYEPKVKIDLSGPDGNVFVLIKTAMTWGRKRGMTQDEVDEIRSDMMSGDYDHAIEVFDYHFGDMCDLYLPKTGEEAELVSSAKEIKERHCEIEEAKTFYEAVCLDNSGYEDKFEVGITYRVLKNGKKIIEVEDMFGESQEVMVERFGEITKVEGKKLTPEETEEYLINKLKHSIEDDNDGQVVKWLKILKKHYCERADWLKSVEYLLSEEEFKLMNAIITRQLKI